MKLKGLLTKKIIIAASSGVVTISGATTTGVLVSKIKSKTDISKIELKTDIGSIKEKNNNLIIQKFIDINKDKLTELNKDDFDLKEENTNSIVLEVKKDNQKYKGEIIINFKLTIDISTLDLDINVGSFNSDDASVIIQKFIDINKDKLTGLNKDDFEILSNENELLIIKVKDSIDEWSGQVLINFDIKTHIQSIGLFKNFAVDNDEDQEIITTFLRINNKVLQNDLTKDDLEIKKIPGRVDDSAKAILKVKDSSNKYQGEIEILYRIRKDINMIEGLKTELFCLDPNADKEAMKFSIKKLFFELNKEKIYPLDTSNLDVVNLNIKERKVSIKVINSEEFKGQVEITLQDKLDISKISSLITTINKYSTSTGNFEIKDFINANKDKLPLLLVEDLKKVEKESTKDKWVIEVKNSRYYQGRITINLKKLTDISNNENIKRSIDLKDAKPFENNITETFYQTNKSEFDKLEIKKENIKPSTIIFKREEVTIQILGSDAYYASFKVNYKFNRIDINTLSSRIRALNLRGKEEINEEVIKQAFAQQYRNFFFKYNWEFFGYAVSSATTFTQDDVKVIKIDDNSVEVEILYESWFKNTLKLKLIK
ncbi:Hypothetical protein, predicted transmembrane protein [Mycoplasma yeatsii 13926]|uniref:Uncharacterized protein n=1 Tax=Mycoplasma yeatsii 13926 TaxID=1188240 RepID=S6G3K5_9MOLU|nr:hypothetical protein [Mycoplasma yeatsii]EOA07281.1 Hypothetical protein, predicted transmembrane protein [Mycoplasma yeatsii 13926]